MTGGFYHYYAIHSTNLHGGSTKHVSLLYSRRPFLCPRALPNSTHAAPIATLLIPTNRILSYYIQSRRLTSSTHTHTQHSKSTITSILQDGGVLTTCRRILPTLRNQIYQSPRRHHVSIFNTHLLYSFSKKVFQNFWGVLYRTPGGIALFSNSPSPATYPHIFSRLFDLFCTSFFTVLPSIYFLV